MFSNDRKNHSNVNSIAYKRLMVEYKKLTTDCPPGITAGPLNEDSFLVWEATRAVSFRKNHSNVNSIAYKRLMVEYKKLTTDCPPGITAGPLNEDSFLVWEATIMGPQDTIYEGGLFTARLFFPPDYPLSPPKMNFTTPMWHPNIYPNGEVCISILHAPGDDPHHYEKSCERWSPIQSVEKILLSVISMLAEPNDESPANIDAAKMWRNDKKQFCRKVLQTVRKSLE